MKKPTKADVKKLRKGARRIVAKSVARRSLSSAVIKAESDALQHLRQLEQQVAKSAGGQDAWGLGFLINRQRANLDALQRVRKAAVPSMDNFASVDNYLRSPNPAAAGAASSRAATQRAISSAQGDPINQHLGRQSSLDVMRDILNDRGEPEPVQDFEAQTRKLEKQLADAQTPSERESLGYQVTRRKLLAMHARGEG